MLKKGCIPQFVTAKRIGQNHEVSLLDGVGEPCHWNWVMKIYCPYVSLKRMQPHLYKNHRLETGWNSLKKIQVSQ